MAKQSCCPKKKLRRGLWSPEEDEKLMNHIAKYGHGCWSSVPKLAGLERCGKSCRLRWINYLRPDLKRGTFSQEEEDLIIHLHSMLGNKWSQIAAQLPGRTDNEVKNFWNSYIKKRLRERGIDPVTHKPLPEAAAGGSGGVAASTAMTSTSCAVFSDAELVPAHLPPMPAMDGSSVKFPLDRHTSLSCYQTPTFAGYFDMDALNCHSLPPAVIPSASSSSTLNSMAGLSPVAAEEQCNVTTNALELQSGAGNLPWQELEPCTDALDELRWCDYFEGSFQSTASHGAGQCVYEDSKGGVQFDVHGLSNWC